MKTDFLVIGCGASAMSFVDVMLAETDATFVIVDKRDAPGGIGTTPIRLCACTSLRCIMGWRPAALAATGLMIAD